MNSQNKTNQNETLASLKAPTLNYFLFMIGVLVALTHYSFPVQADSLQAPGLLIAQGDESDAYDPFADYSEFEEATDEEADINFFRNGRFLSLGFVGGYRMFTNILGELYSASPVFGGFLSYFFDLRFAIQIGYFTGDHPFNLSVGSTYLRGTTTVSSTEFDIKYYMNTQNVTRGLARINPYVVVGVGQLYRTQRFDGQDGYSREGAMGFKGGMGVEFPLMRNKMFFGMEVDYQYVNFADENNELVVGQTRTGIFPRGDIVRGLGILGINF